MKDPIEGFSPTEDISMQLSGISVSRLGTLPSLAANLSSLATDGSSFNLLLSETTDETLSPAIKGCSMFSQTSVKDISDNSAGRHVSRLGRHGKDSSLVRKR